MCIVFTNLTIFGKETEPSQYVIKDLKQPYFLRRTNKQKKKQLDIAASKPAWTGLTLCKMNAELLIKLPGRGLSQYSNIKWSVVFG